jgi:hypothetical protein
MASSTTCQICGVRRARRECPGLPATEGRPAQICSICCGTEREVSISCPLDCEYLREARANEARAEKNHAQEHARPMPHADVKITEAFLNDHHDLFAGLAASLVRSAFSTAGAVDRDVLAALEALIKTYRTIESGLVYETRADDRVAAALQDKLEQALLELGNARSESHGIGSYRPVEILGTLVFLARLQSQFDNGRAKGRRFLDYLRLQFPDSMPQAEAPSLLIL